ncbi:signal recognition particle protein [Liquorilactobacillus satsumensis]|uniref:Signal recognition particle protein n=1 Tax=Liquorilactobacillus satsumensis DSM 16230 = JCM 12392 TaxID=1423801 RepID=A0A0R1V2U0_9LACO|nr:signal recognition particle protein [Liquorilactobacillus satsumensis]KRL99900.1 signal recognition particle protein [Liquorilactobacillus satsumensis DSM 16230 = JCM 12392]MCC7665609.1 signal recognition particle protein [Liquorilactobacillus satsumensis]MCP9311821.1 signal recognition particle protein [Liquorilactobacillus satsumensis]MCP9328379.1 signal recognition particle protein [Liquorilactobacillus satsumensis]MCP9357994.1 signal recognition particle protein [Liquorilactobacillus sa
MAFEGLTERLQNAISKLRRKGKVSEADVREVMREIRLALLEADVNFQVVKDFVKTVRERAIGAEVLESLTPAQQIVKIVNDELTKVMGQEAVELAQAPKIPTIVMMVGLQGAGKTTTLGKLALKLKNEQKARPLLIAGDIYRPAAIDQLKIIGKNIDVPVFSLGTDISPVEIVRQGLAFAQEKKNDYVLIDTAGRLQVDEKLMNELAEIKQLAQPNEILLTVDAMTGQNAVDVAKGFNEQLDVTGIVLTKLDGDTRGGAALSIRAVTGKPIKFIGQGEKMTDLDVFYPDRMASRILGMGDMLTLIEKAQQDFDQKKADEMQEKMRENTFDFNDFIDQMTQVQKMGPMEDVIKMIPGMANNPALKNLKVDPKDIEHLKAIVFSMTEKERTEPDVLNPSRRRRIAAGSGRPVQEVNRMIKQFNQMKKMMSKFSKGNFSGMEGMLGNGISGKLAKMSMNSMMRKNKKRKLKRLRNKRKRK